jgi:ubiquinone/menaquinone biosynthesis C-methylase UbiE
MNDQNDIRPRVQEYWEQTDTVSILDKNLHKIEIETASRYITNTDSILDVGCGDGEATIEYAKLAKSCTGLERSNHLRSIAESKATASGLKNINFIKGDVLALKDVPGTFDVVITQRLLINLLSWEEQMEGIMNVYGKLKPGGRFVMIENTGDSFLAMNDMRLDVGLQPIPQHWHNRFFDYKKLEAFMEGKFELLKTHDLGLYYFLTRVYVPMFSSFSGFGSKAVKDPIYEHSDKAARILYEKFHDQIKIGDHRTFGPIQVFVYRREADPRAV